MLFDLTDPDILDAALIARNEYFDVQAFAALSHALDTRLDLRWSEDHVIRLGYDPSTIRRSFKRQFGMTFIEMARQRRLREGFETLAVRGKVVTAQHQASFESASAFRADVGSAKAMERAGAKTVATSRWSGRLAQGYEDGEPLPFEDILATVARIAKSVNLPVTVNFEGGYAADPETIGQNVCRLLELGIVGFNVEDQIVDGPGLYSVENQEARIRAARDAADSMGVPAVINARTDVFLKADQRAAHAELMEEALVRERAYASAGADSFFVPGLTNKALIRQVCDVASLPVNIVATSTQKIRKISKFGVAHISLGPAANTVHVRR